MKKQILLIVMTFLPLWANADPVIINGIGYNLSSVNGKNEAEVISKSTADSWEGYYGDIVIPESVTYEGTKYAVTSIGGSAFSLSWGVTSVTIPNSVKTIKDYAFQSCDITTLSIPESVVTIEKHAFHRCLNLATIVVDSKNPKYDSRNDCNAIIETSSNTLIVGCNNSVIPNTTVTIGEYAFVARTLNSVAIPASVINIEIGAFEDCDNLTTIVIPQSVKSIGRDILRDCDALATITVESGNSYYDSRDNCNAIIEKSTQTLIAGCKNSVIPNGIEIIGESAFSYCEGLTSITIPSSVKSIEGWGFCGCSNLTNVTMSEGLVSIGRSGFINCRKLSSVSIPSTVTTIGQNAFQSCTGFSSLFVPANVSLIGEDAFTGCSGLTSIKVDAANNTYDSRNNCNAIIETESNKLLYTCKNTTIPNTITSIGDNVFNGCKWLTSITIPEGVVSIGKSAFYGCGLTSVKIPSSVVSIGESGFGSCSDLSSVTFSNNTRSIGTWAFSGTKWLDKQSNGVVYAGKVAYTYKGTMPENTHITIKDGTIGIADDAFMFSCEGMTSVTLPSSLKHIGVGAFYSEKITSITIPNGVESIGQYAFQYTGITAITIPKNVTSIGNAIFRGCKNLASIIVEDGNTVYDSRDNCNAIIETASNKLIAGCQNTTIPNNITTIGESAFNGCSGLTSIIIPEGVTTIGHYAFENSGLTSVTVPKSISAFGFGAFLLCRYLEDFYCYVEDVPEISGLSSEGTGGSSNPQNGTWVFNIPFIKNATLHVPAVSLNAYKTAEVWKEFKNIVEIDGIRCYKLQYVVDGEEYKSYDVGQGTTITPEPAPTKEGYTFSGWSKIPATMPANDVTVTGTFTINHYKLTYVVDGEEYKMYEVEYGTSITPEGAPTKVGYDFTGWSDVPETMPAHDVTITGSFEPHYNVGNVASLIDFILNGNGSLEDFELYDMNGDGELNIGDLILILREVLKNTGGSAPSRGVVEWVEPDFTQYTAAQFVLDVPLNVKEQDIQLAEEIKQTHKMMSRQIVPGRFAVVVYSLTNSKLAPGFIEVKAEKTHAVDLDIKDMVLAKPTGETVSFGNMPVTTAVSDVRCENAQRSVYDLKGRMQGNSLQKGVYIENGKKIVIR